MDADRIDDLLRLLAHAGRLKDLPRAGWVRVGLPVPESVADHSFRAALMALVLAPDLGVDAGHLLRLVLVHDLPEGDPDVGDITPHCGVAPEEKRRRERAAMERLGSGSPHGEGLLRLWTEYDEARTPEADLAHQLDALEMALQAREYEQKHGADLAEFRASARRKVRHPLLLALLDRLG